MKKSLGEIARTFDTDKVESAGYIENYEKHFGRLRDAPVKLFELGVYHGGSLQMWQEFFDNGTIVGLDRNPNPFDSLPERVHFYQGSQDDKVLLDRIANDRAAEGFDIIIDDAAHVGTLARSSFRTLFDKHLKSGGLYVIEDWGTGYWDSWADGKLYQGPQRIQPDGSSEARSLRARLTERLCQWLGGSEFQKLRQIDPNFACHNHGMVGFLKEVIDQLAWRDVTQPGRGNTELPDLTASVHEIHLYFGQAFIVKA